MSTILQDPQTSLNPVFSIDNPIGNLLTEALAMARQDSSQGILSRGAEAFAPCQFSRAGAETLGPHSYSIADIVCDGSGSWVY